VLDYHPFDRGRDGKDSIYPWELSVHDFEPITDGSTSRRRQHQTFQGGHFRDCYFARASATSIRSRLPIVSHSNLQSEEMR